MRAVNITITLDLRHIPDLVCSSKLENSRLSDHVAAVAEEIADAMGLQEFLHRPDRVHELRSMLWEEDHPSLRRYLPAHGDRLATSGASAVQP